MYSTEDDMTCYMVKITEKEIRVYPKKLASLAYADARDYDVEVEMYCVDKNRLIRRIK